MNIAEVYLSDVAQNFYINYRETRLEFNITTFLEKLREIFTPINKNQGKSAK